MNKKILIGLLALTLITFSSVCFATNAGSEVQNSAQKSGTALENMGNGIRNVASDVGNGIQGAASSIGNGVQDMFDGNDDNDHTMMGGTGTTGGYTATRTGTDVGGTGMTNTAWVWLILGITGVVIVALTWYYVTQDTSRKR